MFRAIGGVCLAFGETLIVYVLLRRCLFGLCMVSF